jgi:hypothetical protein
MGNKYDGRKQSGVTGNATNLTAPFPPRKLRLRLPLISGPVGDLSNNASGLVALHTGNRRPFLNFTPAHWRKRLIAGFAQPLLSGVVPTREFSARPAERTMSA